jgi:hypothetical protein
MASPNPSTLHPDLAKLAADIDANLRLVESLVPGLSPGQFNWRSAPGRWSIGACINHLNIVDGSDLAALDAAISTAHAQGLTGSGPFTYGWISRKFVASMEPAATRKFKAPKAYMPPPDSDRDQVLAEFRRISAELRRLVHKSNGLDLARVKTSLPTLPALLRPLVKMPLGARLALLTTHDRRHLWQAQQVRNDPGFPKI